MPVHVHSSAKLQLAGECSSPLAALGTHTVSTLTIQARTQMSFGQLFDGGRCPCGTAIGTIAHTHTLSHTYSSSMLLEYRYIHVSQVSVCLSLSVPVIGWRIFQISIEFSHKCINFVPSCELSNALLALIKECRDVISSSIYLFFILGVCCVGFVVASSLLVCSRCADSCWWVATHTTSCTDACQPVRLQHHREFAT